MHHMHQLLGHALVIGVEGSNLIMMSEMGLARVADDYAREHGERMLANAQELHQTVMTGKHVGRP